MKKNVSCPVCENHVFEWENDFDICPICGWENDGVQCNDYDCWGGANELSVNESKLFFSLFQSMEKKDKLLKLEKEHGNIIGKIYNKYKGIDYRIYGDKVFNELDSEHSRYMNEINKLANTI